LPFFEFLWDIKFIVQPEYCLCIESVFPLSCLIQVKNTGGCDPDITQKSKDISIKKLTPLTEYKICVSSKNFCMCLSTEKTVITKAGKCKRNHISFDYLNKMHTEELYSV
jgi:hypothetical protein